MSKLVLPSYGEGTVSQRHRVGEVVVIQVLDDYCVAEFVAPKSYVMRALCGTWQMAEAAATVLREARGADA